MVEGLLHDWRTGKNTQHTMAALFRQSIYSRLAGYEDIPRELFRAILERIRRLNPPEAVPG